MESTRCEECGSDALATVLVESEGGAKQLRRYCRECERRRAQQEREELRTLADGLARLLVYCGVLLALLTAFADYLAIAGLPGFGWRQMAGAEIGFLGIVLGFALRKGLLGMAGLFLLVLSIGADLLHIGHVRGLGWRSHLGFLVATALVVAGFLWRRAVAHGSPLPPARPREATRGEEPESGAPGGI